MSEEDMTEWFIDLKEIMNLKKWTTAQLKTSLKVLLKVPCLAHILGIDNFEVIKKEMRKKSLRRTDSIHIHKG
jgi:hypothetical protein